MSKLLPLLDPKSAQGQGSNGSSASEASQVRTSPAVCVGTPSAGNMAGTTSTSTAPVEAPALKAAAGKRRGARRSQRNEQPCRAMRMHARFMP